VYFKMYASNGGNSIGDSFLFFWNDQNMVFSQFFNIICIGCALKYWLHAGVSEGRLTASLTRKFL